MKILNASIKSYVISGIIFIIFCIIIAVFISIKIYENNIHKTYVINNFTVDLNPNISSKLEKLSDLDGLKSKQYDINITNNNDVAKKYQILLSPLCNEEGLIRLSLDNRIIKTLKDFEKNSDGYILLENNLDSSYSILHNIKLWLDKNSNIDKLKVDFNIKINVIDE